jgi:surface antigen
MAKTLLSALALMLAAPALALNMSGFKDAPITRLTSEEVKLFHAAIMKTLDETPDGTTVEWKAPKTRFVSKITPQKTFTEGALKCRETTVESDAHDRFQRGIYSFCKGGKGNWQFKNVGGKAKAK